MKIEHLFVRARVLNGQFLNRAPGGAPQGDRLLRGSGGGDGSGLDDGGGDRLDLDDGLGDGNRLGGGGDGGGLDDGGGDRLELDDRLGDDNRLGGGGDGGRDGGGHRDGGGDLRAKVLSRLRLSDGSGESLSGEEGDNGGKSELHFCRFWRRLRGVENNKYEFFKRLKCSNY